MQKDKAITLLQGLRSKVTNFTSMQPDDDEVFYMWKEESLMIIKEFFPQESRWIKAFMFDFPDTEMTEETREHVLKALKRADTVLKAGIKRIELFGLDEKRHKKGKPGITIRIENNLTNTQTLQLDITMQQILTTIDLVKEKSEKEKEEAKRKLQDLEKELKKAHPTWNMLRPIIVWLLEFSKDVFMQTIPFILGKIDKIR